MVGSTRLKHARHQAQLRGDTLGEAEVRARFAFTSRSGSATSLIRRYTLQLK
jgi:hypothetical protein